RDRRRRAPRPVRRGRRSSPRARIPAAAGARGPAANRPGTRPAVVPASSPPAAGGCRAPPPPVARRGRRGAAASGPGCPSAAPVLVLEPPVQCLVHHPFLGAALGQGGGGGIALVAQLGVAGEAAGIQPALGDRRLHGAAGFVAVAAVAEAAFGGDLLDVLEAVGHVLVAGELQLAHAGRV